MTSETSGARIQTGARRVRHDGWTAERRRGVIEALAKYGNVRDACRAVGMSNVSAYRLRRNDPTFGAEWDAALKRAATSLEAIAYQRATEGAEEIVIRDGKEAWRKKKPSDSILRMILQASNPEKYGRTGPQSSVKAREELEARIKEIELAAYARAWAVLTVEYRAAIEPEYLRIHLWRKLHMMHTRMCNGGRSCPECHPELHDPKRWTPPPPEPHHVMPGPRAFLGPPPAETESIDYMRGGGDRPEPERRFYRDAVIALEEERAACNLAGREMELGPRPDLSAPDPGPPPPEDAAKA